MSTDDAGDVTRRWLEAISTVPKLPNAPRRAAEPECEDCAMRETCLLGCLPPEVRHRFEDLHEPALYPRGVVLFSEGGASRGVHVLCSGMVKTYACSREGRTVILRLAGPGQVLGLTSILTGGPYPATAEVLRPARVLFLPRALLLPALTEDKSTLLAITHWLAEELRHSWDHARMFSFSRSPQVKIAQLLLFHAASSPELAALGPDEPLFVKLDLTEREIAEMIGTSREAVSCALSELQRRKVIRTRNGGIEILNRETLSELGQT